MGLQVLKDYMASEFEAEILTNTLRRDAAIEELARLEAFGNLAPMPGTLTSTKSTSSKPSPTSTPLHTFNCGHADEDYTPEDTNYYFIYFILLDGVDVVFQKT